MAINITITPTKSEEVKPSLPVLRQHKRSGAIYIFTDTFNAIRLSGDGGRTGDRAYFPCGAFDPMFVKCSITLTSED